MYENFGICTFCYEFVDTTFQLVGTLPYTIYIALFKAFLSYTDSIPILD